MELAVFRTALTQVLPGPTDRASYSELRETIFGSSAPTVDLMHKQGPSTCDQKSAIHILPVDVLLEEGLLNVLLTRVLP